MLFMFYFLYFLRLCMINLPDFILVNRCFLCWILWLNGALNVLKVLLEKPLGIGPRKREKSASTQPKQAARHSLNQAVGHSLSGRTQPYVQPDKAMSDQALYRPYWRTVSAQFPAIFSHFPWLALRGFCTTLQATNCPLNWIWKGAKLNMFYGTEHATLGLTL